MHGALRALVMPVAAMTALLMPTTAEAQHSPEEKMAMMIYAVTDRYVDSVAKAPYVDAQIARMAQALDPFSQYLTPQEAAANEQMLVGMSSYTPAKGDNPAKTVRAAYMADKHTGYINLSMFSNTTPDELRQAINSLKKSGMRNLILDLQQNGGGLVDEAVKCAGELLGAGKLVFTARGAHIPTQEFKTTSAGSFEKGKLYVLISNRTMSAAELFSGALRDYQRATFVGQRSFGKGLIQETLPFSDGSALRITVARYFTPKGYCLQKPYKEGDSNDDWGIKPDYTVAGDTLHRQSFWYNLITYSGVQALIARQYAEANKAQVLATYKNFADYNQRFDAEPLFNEVVKKSDELQYQHSDTDFAQSKDYIKQQLKALVASHVYGQDYFQRVMNERNPAYIKALELAKAGKLAALNGHADLRYVSVSRRFRGFRR